MAEISARATGRCRGAATAMVTTGAAAILCIHGKRWRYVVTRNGEAKFAWALH